MVTGGGITTEYDTEHRSFTGRLGNVRKQSNGSEVLLNCSRLHGDSSFWKQKFLEASCKRNCLAISQIAVSHGFITHSPASSAFNYHISFSSKRQLQSQRSPGVTAMMSSKTKALPRVRLKLAPPTAGPGAGTRSAALPAAPVRTSFKEQLILRLNQRGEQYSLL